MARIFRTVVFVLSIAFVGSFPALAGDRTLANIVGYSNDLRYFAFEEFGIQDGSGFPYSSYYVIDLKNDHWVVGTPIRVIAEDETETLANVRALAASQISPWLKNLAITVPAHELASNGDGAPGNDGQSLSFGLPLHTGPDDVLGNYTLQLAPAKVAAAAPCVEWFAQEAVGFTLTIEDYGVAREVHRDATLARSRGCPIAYRISSVFAPYQASDISASVALISVFTLGFEGPDRRFIIVPLAYTQQAL